MSVIREFCSDDYNDVYQLWQRAGLEMRTSDTLEELQRVIDRDEDLFLVALDNNVVVGAVLGAFDGRRGWVYHLAVDPTRQRTGVGTILMEELLRRFSLKGVVKVNLTITSDNKEVCSFYERLGFSEHNYIVMGIPLQGEY